MDDIIDKFKEGLKKVKETVPDDLLKKGGVWVNLGCLDYYHSRMHNSIDLTWDELRHVIINYDFDIKNEVTDFIPYGVKVGSMMSDSYGTVFFTAVKK